ncbi:hypothetical protein [Anaerosporobacter sp.]|uniref:hypothetical protein n=1 Tax=Anaerosporobacter sp. TaxID=1872529 RepID=UPI00286ED925|nr:hypothetical protein [Anaerosporobacter sp.]
MAQKNDTKITSTSNTTSNKTSSENVTDKSKTTNKINMDYDWNSEYGDGDIPDIDK